MKSNANGIFAEGLTQTVELSENKIELGFFHLIFYTST